MKNRKKTLWKVVLYFPIASLIGGYLRVALSSLYMHRVTNPDGTLSAVVDPLKEGLVNGGLLLVVILIGGIVFFRTMSRKEIAQSAAILTAIEVILVLLEQVAPNFIRTIFIGPLGMMFSLFSMVASYIAIVLPVPVLPHLIAALTPMVFVFFGRKTNASEQ